MTYPNNRLTKSHAYANIYLITVQNMNNEAPKNQTQLITGIPEHLKPTEAQIAEAYTHGDSYYYPADAGEVDDDVTVEKLPLSTPQIDDYDEDWSYTMDARNFHGDVRAGRRIIGRDEKIDGGLYTGTYGGEAIVVDTKKYPKAYDQLLSEVKSKITRDDGSINRAEVLGAVFKTVSEKMRYSQSGVDNLLQEIAQGMGKNKLPDFTKVELSDFIDEGIGVCRHQALTVGILLEKLKEAGIVRGDVSVDRSMGWSPKGEREGHAWVRYTNSAGEAYILDVAMGYIGPLEAAEGEKRGWDYLRPEEQRLRASEDAGSVAVRYTAGFQQ